MKSLSVTIFQRGGECVDFTESTPMPTTINKVVWWWLILNITEVQNYLMYASSTWYTFVFFRLLRPQIGNIQWHYHQKRFQ